ncbi:hypothetical protein ACP275_03G029500 [Erythranthe tilingii]
MASLKLIFLVALSMISLVSARPSVETCQTTKDCRITCKIGFPICSDGICTCSDVLGSHVDVVVDEEKEIKHCQTRNCENIS